MNATSPQAQTSERERLIAEVAKRLNQDHECHSCHWWHEEETAEVVDIVLRADAEKIRALEADAARYAWLKDRMHSIDFGYKTADDETISGLIFNIGNHRVSANLDATIDAALAATQSPRSEGARDDTDH